ncbi:hypothetical protein EMGBD1_16360 [Anaerolineaceae bacterium]|nr:hypothetical protein EMGBD1_16360 [Anaerolineaceae bacterium]
MKTNFNSDGRTFSPLKGMNLMDMGELFLECDEQITITTNSGAGNDITRKSWGFYLSNSLNHTLRKRGFRTALVLSDFTETPTLYINIVEEAKIDEFLGYLSEVRARVLTWLDTWVPEAK